MADPKNKILRATLPAELYEQLEAAAAADDRDLERYVVRMIREYLAAVSQKAPVSGPLVFQPVQPAFPTAQPGVYPHPAPVVFPTAEVTPRNPPPPVGRAIPLALKGGHEGAPIDLLADNALNGQPVFEQQPARPVPVPNPNAPDLFGASHKK